MNIKIAVILVLSFAELFYNEVKAGNLIRLEAPEGYLDTIHKAIETLREAVQKL